MAATLHHCAEWITHNIHTSVLSPDILSDNKNLEALIEVIYATKDDNVLVDSFDIAALVDSFNIPIKISRLVDDLLDDIELVDWPETICPCAQCDLDGICKYSICARAAWDKMNAEQQAVFSCMLHDRGDRIKKISWDFRATCVKCSKRINLDDYMRCISWDGWVISQRGAHLCADCFLSRSVRLEKIKRDFSQRNGGESNE